MWADIRSLTTTQKHVIALGMGALAIFWLLFFTALAYLNSPNYDPLIHTISKLGIQSPVGGMFFTIGLVVGGTFLLSYFWMIREILPLQSDRMILGKSIINWSHVLTLLASVFLILVGLLPDRGSTVIPHFLAAAAMFTSLGVAIFIWSLVIWETSSDGVPFSRSVAFFGFLTCFVAILHGIFSSIKFHGPLWQKTAVLFYLAWFLVFNAWWWMNRHVLNNAQDTDEMATASMMTHIRMLK